MDVNRGTSEDLKKDTKSVISEIDHFIKIERYDHE